jgi:hypothetical protein
LQVVQMVVHAAQRASRILDPLERTCGVSYGRGLCGDLGLVPRRQRHVDRCRSGWALVEQVPNPRTAVAFMEKDPPPW